MPGGLPTGGLRVTRRVPEPAAYDDMHILYAAIDYANISGLLRMPGSSTAITIGETPPTSSTAGTGIWIDRTGLYTLNSDTVGVTITSTGITLKGSNGATPVFKFYDASTDIGSMYGYIGGDGYYYGEWDMGIPTGGTASRGIITLNAYDGANTGAAQIILDGYSKTVKVVNDLRVAEGLHVGSIATDPTDNNIVADGTITGTQLISNIAVGTAPLVVTSTTKVTNLDADTVDGQHAATLGGGIDFLTAQVFS